MLSVKDLKFRYNKFSRPVLQGASLELQPGEIGILLGKNGSGKTTLFKNILGIHKPDSGSIFFENEDLLKMSRKDRARRIAYVPQDIHFGALTVFDSVMLGRISYFGMKSGDEDYKAVEKILMDMQLLEDYPWWLAMYDITGEFPCKVDLWQYTNTGKVPGIEGNVDVNLMFVDYGLGAEVFGQMD